MISKGNYIKFARFVPDISDEAKTRFFFVQCMIKQLLDSVFVLSRIMKASGSGYQLQPSASADNPYLDLDYSGYHKNLIQ